MLVLSRKVGDEIQIGEDVTITVVRVGPNTVRLGITAPREMSIVRSELIAQVQEALVNDADASQVEEST